MEYISFNIFGSETFNTGATATAAVATDYNKIFILKESATRIYAYDLTTGFVDAAGTLPYAAPAAYEGHRMTYLKTTDGIPWLYVQRASGHISKSHLGKSIKGIPFLMQPF